MQGQQQGRRRTRFWIWAVLGGLTIILFATLVQPALAAIQLSYFNIISNPTSVILQWGTTSEFNVQGFEVQCKLASEPDTAFHRIGFLPAKGGPSTPAQYTFPVTTGVEPGVPYCFRLLELTTDGTQGEAPTLCGYGPNVTPTPGAPGILPTHNPNTVLALPTDTFGNPILPPPAARGAPPAAVAAAGRPCVGKPVMASSCKGQSVVRRPEDVQAAWDHAQTGGRATAANSSLRTVIVEGFIDFDYEITQLTVRALGADGQIETHFCDPIGHVQVSGDYVESWQPHPMTQTALAQARRCLLYTSPSPRDRTRSRMPSSA